MSANRWDLVFEGADAAVVARVLVAGDLGAGRFGWCDGSDEQVQRAVTALVEQQFRHHRRFTYDLRPHVRQDAGPA